MTKSELIDALSQRGGLTKARAEQVVNGVFESMSEAMRRREGIEIRGFGSFTMRARRAKAGRNPRSGEPVSVPAKHLPFFKVGKELRALVDESRAVRPELDDQDSDDS